MVGRESGPAFNTSRVANTTGRLPRLLLKWLYDIYAIAFPQSVNNGDISNEQRFSVLL